MQKKEGTLLELLRKAQEVFFINALCDEQSKAKIMWGYHSYDTFTPIFGGKYIELARKEDGDGGKMFIDSNPASIKIIRKASGSLISINYGGEEQKVLLYTEGNLFDNGIQNGIIKHYMDL